MSAFTAKRSCCRPDIVLMDLYLSCSASCGLGGEQLNAGEEEVWNFEFGYLHENDHDTQHYYHNFTPELF